MDGFIGTSRYENGMSLQVLFRIISRFVCMKIRTEILTQNLTMNGSTQRYAILTQNHEMHGILARYSSACCATVRYAILTQNVEWDPKVVRSVVSRCFNFIFLY